MEVVSKRTGEGWEVQIVVELYVIYIYIYIYRYPKFELTS